MVGIFLTRVTFLARLHALASLCFLLAGLLIFDSASLHAERVLGLDVSAWQGNISAGTWSRFHSSGNQDFVFIRSSRGGTTGFYNQSDPNNNNGQNTLSQRYDDPYFVQNITQATNAGLLAGPYHFSRADIVSNIGANEADHFIEMAGAWMRPGYLLPVHDLEAGDGFRSDNEIAQFSLDFSDRIHEVMGIRPAIYLNGNYAHFVIGGASANLRQQVVDTYPVMWVARPDSSADVQNENPSDYLSWTYGAWDDPPNPAQPWSFWQHSWTGRLRGFNGDLDFNVANGGIEFLKDNLVPALWTGAGSGDWSTLANWNSGQPPVAPVQGSGQVPRVGPLTLPDVRLPSVDDTVILDPLDGSVVTLTSGDHEIRKLVVREQLDIVGGSLVLNYIPHSDSTPYSAKFSADVALTGGDLSAHTIEVDASQTLSFGSATLTLDQLQLMPHSRTPATLQITGDVIVNPLEDAAAAIVTGSGTGNAGSIDHGGHDRAWEVANGAAGIDLSIDVPVTNGGLIKTGAGLLELSGANTYEGDTSVMEGILSLTGTSLADESNVHLESTAILSLDFVGTDTIESLFIDGLTQAVGTWGALGSGAQFTSPSIQGTGILQVSSSALPLPGDFDLDGDVDDADLLKWQVDFGTSNGSDADSDGDSDGADYLAWQLNDGAGANALASSQAVPEPTACLLLTIGLAGVMFRPALRSRRV